MLVLAVLRLVVDCAEPVSDGPKPAKHQFYKAGSPARASEVQLGQEVRPS